GAVRLSERHLQRDPPTATELAALDRDIDAQLDPLALPSGVPIVGTAGTATTIAAVALALRTYDADAVTGFRVEPAKLDAIAASLARMSSAERARTPGVEPERADVIVGGVAIYARLVRRLRAPVLIACDRGIRWGVAIAGVSARPHAR